MISKSSIIPALADLRQDIAGPIPVEIIKQWALADDTQDAHDAILEPYKRTGTMVNSDSAGLSKLSAGRPLVEVMKLVSCPKEIIYSHGTAIGGRAIGIWAADNTQMFYDDAIDPHDVVMQMVAAQKEIQTASLVRVGIGIDTVTAYEIGGGLYGSSADAIELITEDETNADDILLTNRVMERLRPPLHRVRGQRHACHILDYAGVTTASRKNNDVHYPAPFDRAFHESLLRLDASDPSQLDALHRERVRTKTIVLVRMFHGPEPLLLNALLVGYAASLSIHSLAITYGLQLVKSNGGLAILAADDDNAALRFAQAMMEEQRIDGIPTNIGIAKGDVLIFDLGHGLSDLAGGPVNIASKLAEDTEDRDTIFIESSVPSAILRDVDATPFRLEKSSVLIEGWRIGS